MLFRNQAINRWIETHPAQIWKEGFHPCMRRAVGRGVPTFAALIKVSAHVTAGNSGISNQRNHDVREVLTYSLSRSKGMLDGRIYGSTFLYVTETIVHASDDIV